MKLDEIDEAVTDNNVLLDMEWRALQGEDRQPQRKPLNGAMARQKLENYLEEKKLQNELRDIFDQ